MQEKVSYISNETIALIIKVLPPALIAVSVSIAFKMKKEKITVVNAILSIIIGVGTAWIASPFILDIKSEKWHVPLIALVAISGDKIAEYFVYKLDVDVFFAAVMNAAQDFIINIFKKK